MIEKWIVNQTGALCRFFILTALFAGLASCGSKRETLLADAAENLKSGNMDGAKQIYQDIVKKHPFDVDAIEGMVNATKNADDPSEHTQWCRQLLQLQPWDRYANLVIGQHQMEQGNLKDAAVRFYMAYLDSDFKQDKLDVLKLFERIRNKEQEQFTTRQESNNESKQPAANPQ